MKSAIIFGGNGFIGSHLASSLMETGDYAEIVSADISPQPRFSTPGVRIVHCDVREPIPDDIAKGVSEIYNLAAVHVTPGHPDWEYFWTNVLGAVHVCDFARRNGIDTIVFTSSISVYGPSEALLSEDDALRPTSAYGRSKLSAEKIHRLWREEMPNSRRLIVARPAVVFGYREKGNFTRLAQLLKTGRFVYPGRKGTVKSCCYVRELIETFSYFLSRPLQTVTYNVAYSERYTTEDICAAFHEVAGFRVPKRVVPVWLMLLAGAAFEAFGAVGMKTSVNRARVKKLIFSTNIVPKVLDESGYVRTYPLKTALRDWAAQSGGKGFL